MDDKGSIADSCSGESLAAAQFFAHSTEREDKGDWQSLQEHLLSVGELAASRAAWFGAGPLARIAGLLHDLGKYTREFQMRLCGQFSRLDHATWGARIACQRYGALGRLLAYGIAGHHAGLADGAFTDSLKRSPLKQRLETSPEYELLPQWEREIALPAMSELSPPAGFTRLPDRWGFQQAMLGRMLFSCLVDSDFIDTENFYRALQGKRSARTAKRPTLEALRAQLDRHLAGFSREGTVNVLRGKILGHVREQAALDPGLFSLTVPTGGGKTLASLAFALDHAISHGLRRVIFVIPFTSIVEQNAAVFRQAFGDLGDEAVLEHHSAFVDNPDRAPQSKEKLRLAMENWDAPVIVTTAVQFFESLFADRPARCRKLHNIAGSVVILDEAQTLPLKLLRPTVAMIGELALNYRTSILLCTATQPALTAGDGFREGLSGVRELAPDPHGLYESFRRVSVRHAGVLDDAALTDQLRRREQVLCIVNNRRHARALYESIADQTGARHLTTLMCARHRSEVLEEIREDLKVGVPCRLVSTSLIEAGVDVDFPAVLRAEAGLDSIAQAAGRCNREGRRSRASSEVLVFAQQGDDWAPPPELKQFAQVFREVQRKHPGDLLALAAIADYFKLLYWQKGPQELDAPNLMGLLRESRPESLPFETLASKYRIMDAAQLPVIVPFDQEAKTALRELAFAEGCGAIARRLQPYLVQLPRQGYQALLAAGAIVAIRPDRYGDQFMQLANPDLYHPKFGLHWDDPAFLSAERLIV
ncbi:CRISPR-associated endonuclease Cas3'' [Rhodanobacter sp. BL-MT-08]